MFQSAFMRTSSFSQRWHPDPRQPVRVSIRLHADKWLQLGFCTPMEPDTVSIRLHADKWLQLHPVRPSGQRGLRFNPPSCGQVASAQQVRPNFHFDFGFNPPSCGQVASAYPPQPTQINIELRPTSECKALHLTIQTSSNAYFTLHPYILLLHQSSIRLLNLIRHFSATQPPNKRSGTLRAPLPVLARRSLKRLAFVPNGR